MNLKIALGVVFFMSIALASGQLYNDDKNGNSGIGVNITFDSDDNISGIFSEGMNFITDLDVEWNEDRNSLLIRAENEQTIETNIGPQQAIRIAQENSQSRCDEECRVELYTDDDETGQEIAIYEVETSKSSMLFGFIESEMTISTKINAESGEIIDTDKSWWSFLASESNVSSENG